MVVIKISVDDDANLRKKNITTGVALGYICLSLTGIYEPTHNS